MFLRPIAPSSWDRLHFYTSRVREFCNRDPWKTLTVHDSVYAYLGQEKPIFPKLRTLHLSKHLCKTNTFIFFLTTSLQEVSWPYDSHEPKVDGNPDLGPSLALLVSKSPGLKSLTLSSFTYSGLSLLLRRLFALEYLSVMWISHPEVDLIHAIALLPKLTNLSLTLPPGTILDSMGAESGFPSLTRVKLYGLPSNTRKFLAFVRPQALQELVISWEYISVVDQSPLPDIAAITHLLRSFSFLWNLDINRVTVSLFPMDVDQQQLWSIFEPLLELKRLEYLHYNVPLSLSDQKTASIACAWPRLRKFYLYSAHGLSSLESLAHFARHCPDLTNLRYPIELQTATPSTTIPPTLFSHPLRTFESNWEPDITNVPAIALGLYQIFPNLEHAEGDSDGIGWKLVQQILDSFTFLRNQNRRFEE